MNKYLEYLKRIGFKPKVKPYGKTKFRASITFYDDLMGVLVKTTRYAVSDSKDGALEKLARKYNYKDT